MNLYAVYGNGDTDCLMAVAEDGVHADQITATYMVATIGLAPKAVRSVRLPVPDGDCRSDIENHLADGLTGVFEREDDGTFTFCPAETPLAEGEDANFFWAFREGVGEVMQILARRPQDAEFLFELWSQKPERGGLGKVVVLPGYLPDVSELDQLNFYLERGASGVFEIRPSGAVLIPM
jgi:hypothetical protein